MKAIEQFLSLVHADPSRKQELLHYLQTDDQANIIRMASLLGVTLSPEELANRIETPVETASSFSPPPNTETQRQDFWQFVKNLAQ